MDEFKVRSDAERGAHAERILESDLMKEAFSKLEEAYLEAWKATKYDQTDARERLWQAFQIVGKVKTHLATVAANGALARKELEEIENLGQRPKVLGIF